MFPVVPRGFKCDHRRGTSYAQLTAKILDPIAFELDNLDPRLETPAGRPLSNCSMASLRMPYEAALYYMLEERALRA